MCFGGGTDTTTTTQQPNQAFLDAYKNIFSRAQQVADTPYTQYGGKMVADLSPDQQNAFQTVRDSQGIAAPYINSAAGYYDKANTPLWNGVQQFSPEAVNQYASPYTSSVVDATQRQFANANAQQQNDLKGNLISKGAWGGDRAGIAQAALSGQQQTAQAPVIAGLYNQGYSQALNQFNQQQQTGIGVNQAQAGLGLQTGYGMSALGNQAQTSALAGANALAGSGAVQQQQAQAGLNVPYYQWQAQQAYPFQTTSWLSGIGTGLGGASGGTSSTSAPSPSTLSQIGGLGVGAAGLVGATGGFGSSGWLSSLFGSGGGSVSSSLGLRAGGAVPDEPRGILIPFPGHRVRRAAGGRSPLVDLTPSSYAGGIAVPMLRTGTGGGNSTQSYLDSQTPGWSASAPVSYNFPTVDFNPPTGGGGIAGDGGGLDPTGVPLDGRSGADGGAGATDQGYDGKVDTFGDLVNAVLGGFGVVAGGVPGLVGLGINAAHGFQNGIGTKAAFKDLLQTFGFTAPTSASSSVDGLGDKEIEINADNAGGFGTGALGGTMAGGLGGIAGTLGDITGGATNTMSGQPATGIASPFSGPVSSLPSIVGIASDLASPTVMGDVTNDIASADFGGKLGEISSSVGSDSNGGNGGGGGSGGNDAANAEAGNAEHGSNARRGGAIHRAPGGYLPATPWEDLDPGLVSDNMPAFADPIDLAPPDVGDDAIDVSGAAPVGGIAGDPRGEVPWQMPSGGLAAAPGPVARRQGAPVGGGGLGIPMPPPAPPGEPQGAQAAARAPATDERPLPTDPWLSIAKAAFAAAAGRSPHALANIGAGAMAGLDDFAQRQIATGRAEDRREAIKVRRESVAAQREWRQMSAQQAAERLAAQIDHQNRQLAISGGHLGETARHNQAMEENAGRPTSLGVDQDGNLIVADKSGVRVTAIRAGAKPATEGQQLAHGDRQATLALARERYGRTLTNDDEKRIKGMNDAALRVYTTALQMGTKITPEDAEKQAAAIRGAVQQRAAPAAPGQPALPKPGEVRDGYRYKGGDPALPGSWAKE